MDTRVHRLTLCGLLLAGLLVASSSAQATSVWRGVARDGKYDGAGLLTKWPEGGPKLVLEVDGLGAGHSSPAVTEDRIHVTGMVDSVGYLYALDKKGTVLWKTSYGREWYESHSGVRGTPTVSDTYVYVQSGRGRVVCLDPADGKEVWAVDMAKAFRAKMPKWGHAETMLLDGNKIYCTPGGPDVAVAALDRTTGKTIWTCKANGEASGYCSPVIMQHNKKRMLVTMLGASIIAVDPSSGKLLWQHPHNTKHSVNPNTPLYYKGSIIFTSGYNKGAAMLKLSADGTKATEVWADTLFDVQMGGAILLDGHLYGSGHRNRGWKALDVATGKVTGTLDGLSAGCVISAGGLLYCYDDKGTVALVKPSPTKPAIISSFKIAKGAGPHWAHPVIRDGKLYVRHEAFLMVYNISG